MKRMTNIFKKILSFCIIATVYCISSGINNAWAGDCKGIIYVGDSRTVGMAGGKVSKTCTQKNGKDVFPCWVDGADKEGNYWYAKEGVSFSYLSSAISKINSIMNDYDKIVIALGVNDLADANTTTATAQNAAKKYIDKLNSAASAWNNAGKKVYFSLTTPVNETIEEKNNYHVKNANINAFNDAIKKGLSNIGIIDATGSVGNDNYSDGLHYKSYANVLSSISGQVCAGGDGKLGESTPDAGNEQKYDDQKEDCSLYDLKDCKDGKSTTKTSGYSGAMQKCDGILPKYITIEAFDLRACLKNCDKNYPHYSVVVDDENSKCIAACNTTFDYRNIQEANKLKDKYNNCISENSTKVTTVKCPTKTTSKEECMKRNKAIDEGGSYCQPVDDGKNDNDDKKGQCTITKTSTGATKGNKYCGYSGEPITSDITQAIADASQKYNIPAVVLAAYIQVESGGTWNPKIQACIGDGGGGLVQFQPTTWAQYATTTCHTVTEPPHKKQDANGKWVESTPEKKVNVCGQGKCKGKNGKDLTDADRFDAYANIMCAAVLLTDNMRKTDGTMECGILAHNRGAGGANSYKRNHGNCTSAEYYKNIKDAMTKLAKQNDCSLSELGLGALCEYFGSSSSGSSSDSSMEQVMQRVNYQSNYKCSLSHNYSEIKGCQFCGLFEAIYNAASVIARKCHTIFANSLVTLLAVGLAISLAFMVLKFISDMGKQADPGMLLNMVLRKCFVVIVIIALLKMNVTEFFNMFVTPVFTTGFKLAELAIGSSGVDFVTPDPSPWAAVNTEGLPVEMGVSMLKGIYLIQTKLEKLSALGSNAWCIGLYVYSWHGYPFFPHFGYLITGLFLWALSNLFMVIYPFLLIDSVIQFTIASAIFPVALAALPFKITSEKLNIYKVINIFISSMFLFIFLTIVLFILLAGVDSAVTEAITKTAESGGDYFNLEAFAWYTEEFIKLAFFLFLAKAVLADIPSFAESFAQALTMGQGMGTNLNIGQKVGGTAAGIVGNVAKVAGPKAVITTGLLYQQGKKFFSSAYSAGRNARHEYLMNNTENKMADAEAAGLDTSRGVTGRNWFGAKVNRQIITNDDGTKMLQSSRKSLIFGKDIVKTEDQNMSILRKFNKDGTCNEKFTMRSSLSRNLFNSDGTTDKGTLNKIMQTSGLSKEQTQKGIMVQMMKQRMPNAGEKAFLGGKFKSEQLNSYKDDKGHDVFEVRRTDKNGKISLARMSQGDKRTRLDYEEISSDGKSVKYSSDGLIQKQERCTYDVNRDGTFNASTSAVINGSQVNDLRTTADGMLRDKDGHIMGRILANGNLADAQGNVIGTAQAKDLAFGADGRCLGKMTLQGTIIDKNGNTSGYLGNNGTVLDQQGQTIGGMSSANAYRDTLQASKKSSSVEFSNSKEYKGARLFDDNGEVREEFADEETMYDDSELELYKEQMRTYGDIRNHRIFDK